MAQLQTQLYSPCISLLAAFALDCQPLFLCCRPLHFAFLYLLWLHTIFLFFANGSAAVACPCLSMILDRGSWFQDPCSWILDLRSRILDLGSRILDPGSWIMDPGYMRLDSVSWILDPGTNHSSICLVMSLHVHIHIPLPFSAHRRGEYIYTYRFHFQGAHNT